MSLDQEAIAQQLALLATHRRTLAHLVQQAAHYGGEVFAPPPTASGIAEARAEVARIKAALREHGVPVDDAPSDQAPPHSEPPNAPAPASGARFDQSSWSVDGSVYNVAGDVNIGRLLAPALHQLRAPVGDFVGRAREIDQLEQQLRQAASSGAAAAISGVRGMGGIGKTELAYAAAQRLAEHFPDAQLLIELRGAGANPLTPEAALQTVIRAFEREARLPDDLAQLKGIYSSALAGKRVLILADDARDAAQVRPLLPPPGCALLITTRNRFGLPGMAALDLGTLPPDEAAQLLLEICPRIGVTPPGWRSYAATWRWPCA